MGETSVAVVTSTEALPSVQLGLQVGRGAVVLRGVMVEPIGGLTCDELSPDELANGAVLMAVTEGHTVETDQPEQYNPAAALKQTMLVAGKLFGRPVEPEYITQVRPYMESFVIPLYRAARLAGGRDENSVATDIAGMQLYMDGVKSAAIMKQLGGTVKIINRISTNLTALFRTYTPRQFMVAFADFVAGRELPDVEVIVDSAPQRSLGKAVLRQRPAQLQELVEPLPRRWDDTAVVGFLVAASGDGDASSWQKRGLCAQTDPEAFFPEKGGSTREAKKICVGCEVRAECLAFALAQNEFYGIWGGLSERERRRLKRVA